PRSNQRRWRGARASSASIAANSLSIARADGTPSVSFRWIGSISSPRARSYFRARSRAPASACPTRMASPGVRVPAPCHGSAASRPRATAAELPSPDARAPRLSRSWPTSFNSLRLEQLRQPLARVEHARLDRVLRNANDLGNLFDTRWVKTTAHERTNPLRSAKRLMQESGNHESPSARAERKIETANSVATR